MRGAHSSLRARSCGGRPVARGSIAAARAAMARLADAHCHVQEDVEHADAVLRLGATHIAAMGTAEDDWPRVQRLRSLAPGKVIPCFGVHPWFAHRHGMRAPCTTADVVEAKEEAELQKLGERLGAQLPTSWQARLRELLLQYPEAVVGEFGVDRAAVIPGTRASVRGRAAKDRAWR